jgi:Fur family ferric uptake transcriptional regulator
MAANQALSENEIREKLSGNYDRTTFYRSFKTLEEHGIVHKIVVDSQIVKYAPGNFITHKKEHPHFYCNDCHTLQCLESIPVQEIQLPDGYTELETEVIIKGICPSCKNNSSGN